MSFNAIYSIGQSGLQSSKGLLALAGLNLANANTPGYARRIADLATTLIPGLGVTSNAAIPVRSPFIAKALVSSFGQMGFQQGQLDGLNLVEEAFNDLDGLGLQSSITAFEVALGAMGANPAGLAERAAVLGAAEQLAAQFASTRQQIQVSSDITVSQAQATATQVTQISAQLAEINTMLQQQQGNPEAVAALVDNRDGLLADLGELVQLQVVTQADGTVDLSTGGGVPLVIGGSASEVSVSAVGPPPDFQVEIEFQTPNGQTQGALGEVGGKLGGLVAAQNDVLGPALGTVDQMAFAFINGFNAQHQSGFDLDGIAGGDFFTTLTTSEGAAANITLSADVLGQPENIAAAGASGNAPGGNGNVLALQQVADQPGALPNGDSIRAAFEGLTFQVAEAIQGANLALSVETASAAQLQNILSSETGVSIDEELILMAQADQAFQAASTFITEAQQMQDTLLAMVG